MGSVAELLIEVSEFRNRLDAQAKFMKTLLEMAKAQIKTAGGLLERIEELEKGLGKNANHH